jgi:hypothetical protein
MSTDTNSLAVWLAARQREALERENQPGSLMTLEEYEYMGSWMDVAKANGESCGVPQCEIHVADVAVISGEEIDVGPSTKRLGCTKAATTPKRSYSLSSLSSPSRSMPQLPSLTSRWFESVDELSASARHSGKNLKATRHQSMPGGWTFPL